MSAHTRLQAVTQAVAVEASPEDASISNVASIESWSQVLDLREALATCGSNAWIVSEQQLEENLAAWIDLAGGRADAVWYPVKANPSPAVLEILARGGAGAECSSRAEVQLALMAGFAPQLIMYNSPAQDLTLALEVLGCGGNVVIDSVQFLLELDMSLSKHPHGQPSPAQRGRVLLRVNPEISGGHATKTNTTSLMSHADRQGKFGVPSEEVVGALQQTVNVHVNGFHVHVGTQMDHLEPFVAVAGHLRDLAETVAAQTEHDIKILDLGGGLGIPFSPSDRFPTVAALKKRLHDACVLDFKYEYWYEPGHALVGNAVGLIGCIIAKKTMRGRQWAIADVGFDQVMKISLLDWTHPVLGPHGPLKQSSGCGAVGGPLCFAGDVVLRDVNVSQLSQGDPIFIQHTGAYCGSCATTFNGRRSGGTVVLRKNGSFLRVTPAAEVAAEPLAWGYTWGAMASPDFVASEECYTEDLDREEVGFTPGTVPLQSASSTDFCPKALSSPVLKDHIETFHYRSSCRVGPKTFEFVLDVDNDVSFCSMGLLTRMAADACIVAIKHLLDNNGEHMPVWGTSHTQKVDGFVMARKPVTLCVHLSEMITDTMGASAMTIRYSFNNDVVTGTFEAAFRVP